MSRRTAKPTIRQQCRATRKDGRRCTALAVSNGLCIGHGPRAQEARRRGGRNKARATRLHRLVPPRLLPVFDALESALKEVHEGELSPSAGTAMATLGGALVRVLTAGELEQRVRKLEDMRQGDGTGGAIEY